MFAERRIITRQSCPHRGAIVAARLPEAVNPISSTAALALPARSQTATLEVLRQPQSHHPHQRRWIAVMFLAGLLLSPSVPGKEISDILDQHEQVEGQTLATSPRYGALTHPQPLRASEIQQQLDADMLLEYALQWDRHQLSPAAGPESLRSFQLPKGLDVEAAARRVYELLTAANREVKGETGAQRQTRLTQAEAQCQQVAVALSTMLLGPVAPLMQGKQLVIVADAALQYIPFSALQEPDGKTPNPLLVRHAIISLPSASALAVLRRETDGRPSAPKVVAALADPVFDSHDPRDQKARDSKESGTQRQEQKSEATRESDEAQAASLSHTLTQDRLTRSATEVGLGRSGELQFPRLVFSRREAEAILLAATAGKGMIAVDFKASLKTAIDPQLAQYRIVHFATHGLLNSERPQLSGLVLSLVDEQGRPQDGFCNYRTSTI